MIYLHFGLPSNSFDIKTLKIAFFEGSLKLHQVIDNKKFKIVTLLRLVIKLHKNYLRFLCEVLIWEKHLAYRPNFAR
jgi:hypothetical protein